MLHSAPAFRPAGGHFRRPNGAHDALPDPMRLTLLIPELIWSEPGDREAQAGAETSTFAKILASRRFEHTANAGWEIALLQLSGLGARDSLAALRMRGDGLPAPAEEETPTWLCADPVHLRFHQERLILADARELALSFEECEGLARRLNDALAGRAEVRFASPERAYLRLIGAATLPANANPPLSLRVGRAVRPSDFGADAQQRALANEIQMLLHDDPVNRARAASGQPVINALWLWGQGGKPGVATDSPRRPDALIGEHPLVKGIAAHLGLPTGAAPDGAAHVLQLDIRLGESTQYQDGEAFAAAWRALERDLLKPTLGALRGGRLERLELVAPVAFGQLHWSIGRLAAWFGPLARAGWPSLLTRLVQSATPPKP